MSSDKNDFFGKEVTDAIKKACESLGEPQDNLEIEVVETGSTGIFGLIRKKAHIRAVVKQDTGMEGSDPLEIQTLFDPQIAGDPEESSHVPEKEVAPATQPTPPQSIEPAKGGASESPTELSEQSQEIIKTDLLRFVELMGFPSTVDTVLDGSSITCILSGDYEEELTGVDGKVLDSLQYILRKTVSRKVQERVRITVDTGNFRQRRLEELKLKAVELAALVKNDGKTQVVPALNPSERREIHMILQEDKEIRSRSVGEGLFKKILIYKPGKGNHSGGGKKGSRSRGRSNQGSKSKRQRES